MAALNVTSTAEAIELMADRMRQSAAELDRTAKQMRESGDITLACEATNISVNLVANLRLDLLVQRPLRALGAL